MTKPIKRKQYFHTNEYQRQIIMLALIPSVVMCLVLSFLLIIFHHDLSGIILNGSTTTIVQAVSRWTIFIMLALWSILALAAGTAYVLSNNLVGAFERIFRELDEVIGGKAKHDIKARQGDKLANELLKRINVIIRSFSDKK